MSRSLFSIIAVLIAGAIFLFFTKPTYGDVKASQAAIVQYDKALDKARQLSQVDATLQSKYNNFDPAQLARLQKMLPDSVNNISLILDLDTLAGKYGMSLENVSVGNAAASAPTVIGSDDSSSSEAFGTIQIKFTVKGSYDQFQQYLADLQSSLRIVDLQELEVQPTGQNDPSSGKPLYGFTMTFSTYWLK